MGTINSLYLLALILTTCIPFHGSASPRQFVHPGIGTDLAQLKAVKDHLQQEPWASAYREAVKDPRAALEYRPSPRALVECGPYSKPDHGCKDELRDAQAAYTQAILWRLSGNPKYVQNAGLILDSWAKTLRGGHTNKNAPLQASWAAGLFARSAELISDGTGGWSGQQKKQFGKFLVEQYLPSVQSVISGRNSCYNGNWHASAIEAMTNIAVLNDDGELFEKALSAWRSFLPAYIYLSSDGASPRPLPWCQNGRPSIARWHGPKMLADGLTQESCRDFEHTAYGLAAVINVAATARIQGLNIYQDESALAERRITKAMELHSSYQNRTAGLRQLCEKYTGIRGGTKGTFELGFSLYGTKKDRKLMQTESFLRSNRPSRGNFHYIWETLTTSPQRP